MSVKLSRRLPSLELVGVSNVITRRCTNQCNHQIKLSLCREPIAFAIDWAFRPAISSHQRVPKWTATMAEGIQMNHGSDLWLFAPRFPGGSCVQWVLVFVSVYIWVSNASHLENECTTDFVLWWWKELFVYRKNYCLSGWIWMMRGPGRDRKRLVDGREQEGKERLSMSQVGAPPFKVRRTAPGIQAAERKHCGKLRSSTFERCLLHAAFLFRVALYAAKAHRKSEAKSPSSKGKIPTS